MRKLITFVILLILIISTGYRVYNDLTYINMEELPYEYGEMIIVDDKIYKDDNILILEDKFYINWKLVKETMDEDIFFEEDEDILIITSPTQVKRFKLDDTIATFNRKNVIIDEPIRKINNTAYIPLKLLEEEYKEKLDVGIYDSSIIIEFKDTLYIYGSLTKDEYLRYSPHEVSPVIGDIINKDTKLRVLQQEKGWFYVLTRDGRFGYVNPNSIIVDLSKEVFLGGIEDEDTNRRTRKVNMTWDYTYGVVRNVDNIKRIPGVNVISPTWFDVVDENGEIYDKGNRDYVSKYRDLGVDIWPSVTNEFDPALTTGILNSSSMREKIINNLLDIFLSYGFQGINIDFENVYYKDKDVMTQFMRELYPIFRENNLVVSMDVTGISTSPTWSMFLDRQRLHKAVDYMVLMAYDQHWASSPIAGSVAEYTWVERSLTGVLELVPNEKMILAMPFYPRMLTSRDGKVSSQAIGMEAANNFVKRNNINLQWKDDIKQFYGRVDFEDYFHEIWIEDINSLFNKVSLVHKYDLAGVASWRKGFETPEVWPALEDFLEEES